MQVALLKEKKEAQVEEVCTTSIRARCGSEQLRTRASPVCGRSAQMVR